jgi:hypothetical protein
MTSKNPHERDSSDRAPNRGRKSGRLGRDDSGPTKKSSAPDRQDETAIEAFEEEGAGIAAKE